MICKNCDAQNAKILQDFVGIVVLRLRNGIVLRRSRKEKSKVGILATIGIILIAVIIAGVFVTRINQAKKQEQYNRYVAEGDKYLEELDH